MLALLFFFSHDFTQDLVIKVRAGIVVGATEAEAAVFLFHFHLRVLGFGIPTGELAFEEPILMILHSRQVELSNQVGLSLLFRVVEHNCWNLEWINIQVLEPLWMASRIHPRVKDWTGASFLVQHLKDLDVRLCVLPLVLLTRKCWKDADGATLLKIETSFLEIFV